MGSIGFSLLNDYIKVFHYQFVGKLSTSYFSIYNIEYYYNDSNVAQVFKTLGYPLKVFLYEMNQKSTATEHGHYHHHLHSSSGLNHEEPLDVLTHLSLPVYGTRKSSRRLLQQLNQNQSNDPQLVGLCNIDCQTNVSAQPSNSSTNELSDATDSVHSIIGDISNLPSSTKVTNTTSQSTQNAAGSTTLNGSVHSSQSGVSIASSSGVTSNTSTAKHQRKWEMWQADDTRWFFEALNEHGKDFNAIHHYMTTKLKKKGTPEDLMKNKEQIRCYFNRQWNKVSGLLDQNNNLLKGMLTLCHN